MILAAEKLDKNMDGLLNSSMDIAVAFCANHILYTILITYILN